MHNRIIIIGSIQSKIEALNGLQPDTEQWNALLTAVNATEDKLNAVGTPQSLKNKIHNKQHQLQEFLEDGEPYDMEMVEQFTDELNELL